MRKSWIIVGVVGIAVLALGAAGLAYAQSDTPPVTNPGYGPEMMGDRGSYVGMRGELAIGEDGPYHELMLESFAEALGIAVDQVEARLDSGEMMWQIAEAAGISEEEFLEIMQQGRKTMVEQAFEDGKLSQEQADFMGPRWQEGGFGGGYEGCMGYGYSSEEGYQQVPQGRWNAP